MAQGWTFGSQIGDKKERGFLDNLRMKSRDGLPKTAFTDFLDE